MRLLGAGLFVFTSMLMTPPFEEKVWQAKGIPEDGQVIIGTSYDTLKRTHSRAAGEQRA